MADENGGKKSPGLLEQIKEDVKALPKVLKEKGKEELESLKEPEKTQLFRSVFRVKHEETPRSRALSVLTNVFFHLHPAKINRDAVRYSYTWGMGGITFYLFIVLTFTGVLLMYSTTRRRCRPSATSCTWSTTFRSENCCATCTAGPPT